MPRSRMIKPDLWDDEILAQSTSRDARLTFIGMWNFSDDYGVVKGSPIWLKSRIFPYEDIDLERFQTWLAELERGGWIIRFMVDGAMYYYIRSFLKHQTINKPSQQRNPEPPQDILDRLPNHYGSTTGVLPSETEVKGKEKNVKESGAAPFFGKTPSPEARAIFEHYDAVFQEIMNIKPEYDPNDLPAVEHELQKRTQEEIENFVEFLVDVYFRDKPDGHALTGTLKTCFKPAFIQAYNREWQRRKWEYGDDEKPATDGRWWRR